MKKKILALLLGTLLLLSLTACGAAPAESTAAPQTEEPAPEAAPTEGIATTDQAAPLYKVGICQYVQHAALDAATEGFIAALNDQLPGLVEFDSQNASGDIPTCSTILNGLVSSGVDLIMANATPPLQAAAAATADIPVLGTSITDYASALEIEDWNGTVGGNVSGTSDLAPLDQQAAMIREWFPDAKVIGMLYCSSEPNSQYQVDRVAEYLADSGCEIKYYTFTDSNDVGTVAQSACDACDVIYIPTDNTAAANTEAIGNVALSAGVPIIAGEAGTCAGCGVATLSIDYYDLGYATGLMAARILTGEADVSAMPIEYAPEVTRMYSAANCAALGITPPEGYTAIEG